MYDDGLYGTVEGEMNAYSSICIIIIAAKKPTIKMNFPEKKYCVYFCIWLKKMPIVWLGLLLISRFLQFTDNTTADVNDKKSSKCLLHVHSLHTYVLDLESISVRYVNQIPGIV